MPESADRPRSTVVVVLGLGYLVLAVVGIATVGWSEFGPERPVVMLGFLAVSTLGAIVHAFLGVVLLVAGLRRAAIPIATVAMVAFIALSVFGVVARLAGGAGDPLNLNWWNVGLYVLSAAVCAVVYGTAVRARSDHG